MPTQERTDRPPGPAGSQRVILASKSPRRRRLLNEYGVVHQVAPELLDDRGLQPGSVEPEGWVMSLAFLKAAAAADHLPAEMVRGPAVVVGADTICLTPDGEALGQPRDREHAERMLRSFIGREHRVLTGVALVDPETRMRDLFFDAATVRFAELEDRVVGAYLDSGAWEGKAGGYNLSERLADGWPIEFDGDPTSIMGLPMPRLLDRLGRFPARTDAA